MRLKADKTILINDIRIRGESFSQGSFCANISGKNALAAEWQGNFEYDISGPKMGFVCND